MNIDVYIFGEFINGYNQYPDDYTKKIFENFYSKSESTTQIVIHRDGNLMYYGYIRKLEFSRYIGFCIVINGMMVTNINGLFSLYENIISDLVSNGQLIHFNEQGVIVTNVDKLYLNRDEIDLITQSFSSGFNKLQKLTKPLPALNNSVTKDSFKKFFIEDNLNDIIDASHTFGYTYIYKSKEFNTPRLNKFQEVIEILNDDKIKLSSQLKELSDELVKTTKQKKQYRFVALLFFIVLGCLIALLSLNINLKEANSTITKQATSLNNKSFEIQSLENENLKLKNQVNKKDYKIRSLENENIKLKKQLDDLIEVNYQSIMRN